MNLDFQSATWHSVLKWAEGELKRAREKNDVLTLTADETAALRGEIRMLKKLIGLPRAAAREVVDPDFQ